MFTTLTHNAFATPRLPTAFGASSHTGALEMMLYGHNVAWHWYRRPLIFLWYVSGLDMRFLLGLAVIVEHLRGARKDDVLGDGNFWEKR